MPAVESFTVTPLDATFGARIEGVRLATIGDDAFARLYRTWLEFGLLVFPGQHLTQDEQVAFARRFGALEIEIGRPGSGGEHGVLVRLCRAVR